MEFSSPVRRYIDAVKPGKYGVPKPLYFPFLPSYWIGKPSVSNSKSTANDDSHSQVLPVQDVTPSLPAHLQHNAY